MTSWCELAIEVPAELSETVASFLFDCDCTGLETVDQSGSTLLKAYFRNDPPIEDLRRFCLAVCSTIPIEWEPIIRATPVAEQNWADNWKEYFRPVSVGRRLCICPPWDSVTSPGRLKVVIEPGMAFGTGQHPTTKGCLELIEGTVDSTRVMRALDIGTGSGILAISLAKLGVEHVSAIDNDATACEIARTNVRENGCSQMVAISSGWEGVTGRFDLIVANLFKDLLLDLCKEISVYLHPEGTFVCSGFLVGDEAALTSRYSQFGVGQRRVEQDWVTLAMRRIGL